jgi:hypothetical protein
VGFGEDSSQNPVFRSRIEGFSGFIGEAVFSLIPGFDFR